MGMKKLLLLSASILALFAAGCDGENTQVADISEAVNGKMASVKNFKSGGMELGGMGFIVADPSKHGGNWVISASNEKNVPEVDVSKYVNRNANYVFLLHAFENQPKGKVFGGEMEIVFADGRKRTVWVKGGRDIGGADESADVLDNALPVYVENEKSKTGVLYLSRFIVNYGAVPGKDPAPISKIGFKSFGKGDWKIAGVAVSSEEVQTTQNYVFDPEVWKPLDTADLAIKEGSALDVSKMMFGAPCGIDGRVVIGKSGKFEFEKKPGVPIKFKGTNLRLANRFPVKNEVVDPSAPRVTGELVRTHEDIDEYVKILKKQGYNAVRWRPAMRGAAEYDAPYRLKPEIQDMYDYYIYALKREGVYIFYYLCSNDDGSPEFRWDERGTLKVKMMLGDEKVRDNWKKLARMQLEHVNPYTGMALKDDPVVATLEYWNEFEIGAENYPNLTAEGKALISKKFAEFLEKKYGTVEKFLADNPAWKQKKPLKTFADADLSVWGNRGSKAYAHFVIKAMGETQAFWENFVRKEIGMKVPTHQNNCNKRLYWSFIGAEGGSYIACNTYFVHPSSYLIGGIVNDTSEFADETNFWRSTINRKVAGMPMTITEYQHCHFNRFKHEAALTFPAYSALNDYDGLVVFDAAVAPRGGELGYFNVAENPVFRANDFINFFLFYRGDVKTSPNRVDILFDKEAMEKSQAIGMPAAADRTKIALMTGFALNFPTARKIDELKKVSVKPATMSISPDGKFNIAEFAKELKAKGILPADNISDPANGVYQSDTGEITMRSKENMMKVVSPKSEAIVMRSTLKNEKLGRLTVKSSTANAAIAVSAVDDKPIAESGRLVLTYNTDAVMKGFGVSKNRLFVTAWGGMPVLIETGKLSAELKLAPNKKYAVYSLKMNGERVEKIPCEVSADGVMKLELDTAKHTAVFFEIVSE